jgi:hypothetical protein
MLQLTPELEESFATVTVKACDPPTFREAVAGLMATLIAGGAGLLPPQPAKTRRASAAMRSDGDLLSW